MRGVYIIKFEMYPDIYKVGCSSNIENRLKNFQTDSAIIGKVELVYAKEFKEFRNAEKLVHKKLSKYRVQANREFFKVDDVNIIIKAVESISVNEISKTNPNNCYMVFIDHMAPLFELRSMVSRHVLDWMLQNADANKVSLDTAHRQELMEELEISSNQVTNSLKTLKDLDLITGDRGTYYINPQVFWKGDTKSRKQILDGKTLKVTYQLED